MPRYERLWLRDEMLSIAYSNRNVYAVEATMRNTSSLKLKNWNASIVNIMAQ